MKENENLNDSRAGDPNVDHDQEEDRRQVYDFDYWESGGIERRSGKERRQHKKGQSSCSNLAEWSSACKEN